MRDADATITSDRLELPLLTLAELDQVGAGRPDAFGARIGADVPAEWADEVRWLAGMRARQVRRRPDDAPWLLRAIVRAEAGAPRTVIGYLNFHAGPDARGMVEVGYTLLPDHRGRGYAVEAVRAAFDWARREHDIHRFRASVAPDNERSLNLIGKLGFVRSGEQWDQDDGLELVFELAE